MKTVILLLAFSLSISIVSAQPVETPDPDPHRFDDEINKFLQWDKKNTYPEDAILFVGSSSIRLWMTGESFPEFRIINRGFGGAHISDVNYFINATVLKYSPRIIVFYAGDNDIADNKLPGQVLEDYKLFVQKVLAERSDTKILYLPIKPSIARWQFWPQMKQANVLIKQYCELNENLMYVDTASPMLESGSPPSRDLFVEDGLHLNSKGYKLWNEILVGIIKELMPTGPTTPVMIKVK
jgi:lysophospholipase L1-like esterase